jgi:glycosyltransferase involved in cell wall biosynthesis
MLNLETFKIALIDLYSSFGGGVTALNNLASSLSKRGHEIHIITSKVNDRDMISNSINYHYFPGYANFFQLSKIIEKNRRLFSKLFRAYKFDVMHAQGVSGIILPPHLSDRLVVTIHGNSYARGFSLLNFAYHYPKYWSVNLDYSKNIMRNLVGHFLHSNLEKIVCHRAKYVFTLTPTEALYARKFYKISDDKICIVPNVVRDSIEDESLIASIPEDKKIILSVGSLEFIKGIPILAETIKQILSSTDDVMYISVGNGSLMPMIKGIKDGFPKKTIIFPYLSKGMSTLYNRATTLIHGSIFEAFGMVIAEAMLQEKPVVTFPVASIPDLVIDNVTGLFAEPFSPSDLASKAMVLVENNEKTRILGLNAKKRIFKISSPQNVRNTVENIYKKI